MSIDTGIFRMASPFVYRYRDMSKGLTVNFAYKYRFRKASSVVYRYGEMPKGLTIVSTDTRYREMPKGLTIVSIATERCRKASPLCP